MDAVVKRRPLLPHEQIHYTRIAHGCILSSLGRFFVRDGWLKPPMALHGGAALHIFHGLQRRSSDMDFLVDRGQLHMLHAAVTDSLDELRRWFAAREIDATVVGSGRTKGDGEVTRYKLSISFPGLIGAVHVHLEFWPVAPRHLNNYPMRRAVVSYGSGEWYAAFRAPDVVAAAADKVIALLSRPHLKWRDIYDLWHLHTNCGASRVLGAVMRAIPRQLKCYEIASPEEMISKVQSFLALHKSDLVEMAKTDLLSYLEDGERKTAEQLGWRTLDDAVMVARGYLTALECELLATMEPSARDAIEAYRDTWSAAP